MTPEKVASTHPYVKKAASFIHDGELAIAVVPDLYASAVEIREHLWRELRDDAPELVALVEELPDDAGLLSERVAALDPGELSRYVEAAGDVERRLQGIVAEVLEAERVGVLDDLIDLGADSLTVVRMSTLISERLGAEISLEAVFDASTIRALARLVEHQ
ncbi:phosphopantetheine-binding protein [Streptosporangium soli]|nr:phosphopantetheine-binding protein [Streptosporangium sp. KLBMP 9127]